MDRGLATPAVDTRLTPPPSTVTGVVTGARGLGTETPSERGGRAPRITRTSGLGVYIDNRKRPVHRWYPFAEAFSSDLIHQALAGAPPDTVVYDPFGGSGTTALAAAEIGLNSCFTEANPYLAWLATVKVNAARDASRVPDAPQALRDLARLVRNGRVDRRPSDELRTLNDRRDYFPDAALPTTAGALALADEHDGPLRELIRLAVAVSLIPASNMIRRTDLRRRRPADPRPTDLGATVATKLADIADDLQVLQRTEAWGTTNHVGGDVRQLAAPDRSFDRIITSPPYLNGTNYCRNTKLELLLLGFIEGEGALSTIRDASIAAGINNMSQRRPAPTELDEVEEVVARLAQVAYDARIPALVRSYFSDMERALAAMHAAASDDCSLLLDIGDSRYSGVHVDTPALLTVVAEAAGWKLVDRMPLRVRRSFDGTPLTQDLLSFQALPR